MLGITHGIEPDHVAGITALTHEAGKPKLSALVGGCFAAGHAALVVLWILLAYLLFGTTSFSAVFEQVGMLFVGIMLSLLGFYLGIRGTGKLVHKHGHDHGDGFHVHYHVHLPVSIRPSTIDRSENHGTHEHDHDVIEYLEIGTVGALFTLLTPVSMIAFISVVMSQSGGSHLVGAVASYSVAIIVTMALIGGGAGSLFRLSKAKGKRFHAISQVVASVLILTFAINRLVGTVPGLLT